MFKKIALAYDGSDCAKKALRHAIDMVKCIGTDLDTVTVEEAIPLYVGTPEEAEAIRVQMAGYVKRLAHDAKVMAAEQGVILHPYSVTGHEVGSIVQFVADGNYDLLIIGSRGHSKLYELLIGSTAHGLVNAVGCSVLVIK
jgi:nucleotide-binding universal stress UspA family protein